ncbi:hypothetical protein BGZ97_004345 [Linnemannia gamsii]|uniref:Uncharacterized protein n=1 Tax=Linnemannia gamsii TaxID=64522 RepID=A0A9P6UH26_9FUNG|nr:hypothetical protein BGZ97_004345 [Linnemannia gamsii]
MQPISGPIPVPGTQREPTTPPVSDIGALTSTSGSSTPTNAVSPRSSVIGKSNTTVNHNHHQRESSTNSTPTSAAAQNQNHHNTHLDHHRHNANNVNSGLRRFPSIGNPTKLNIENATLRAKIIELERYLTGLKEELILAHRQIHAQRAGIKNERENLSSEVDGLKQRIEDCEKELKVRTEECDGLRAQLQVATEKEKKEGKQVEELVSEKERVAKEKGGQAPTPTPPTVVAVTEASTATATTVKSSNVDLDRIKALEEENARKDAQIKQLLEKVDRLGTEVLNLERDKARLERPLTPEPVPAKTAAAALSSAPLPLSVTLESIVPITAAAIIAATTPQSTSPVSASAACTDRVTGLTESASNNSLKSSSTSPSSVGSDSDLLVTNASTALLATVNSVGYDFAVEHPKLLVKFQALRMQHAQASEYVDSLESENRDLKVQLLDVGTGSALVA